MNFLNTLQNFAGFQTLDPSTLLIGQFSMGLAMLQLMLFLVSLFLILLILIQRGKGGGLTGALGGGGGESAFGSKSGDAFTKITIGTSLFWITLCMVTIAAYNPPETAYSKRAAEAQIKADEEAAAEAAGETVLPRSASGSIGAPADEADPAADAEAPADGAATDGAPADGAAAGDANAEDTNTGDGN